MISHPPLEGEGLGAVPQTLDTCRTEAGAPTYLFFGMPVFSASPLRFDSHHRWCSRQDSTCILHRDHRANRGMSPERKSTHAHAQHTCFLPVFSAMQKCAAHDAAILHLRVRVLVFFHKPLIPAEKKPGRRHTCFLECLSLAPVHCALIHIIGGVLGRIARVFSTGITELIVGCRLKERAHMHMHNTPVFCLSSAPCRNALPMMRPSST